MINCVKCSACKSKALLDREVFVGFPKYAVFCKNPECENSKQQKGDKADYFDTPEEAGEKWDNMHDPKPPATFARKEETAG